MKNAKIFLFVFALFAVILAGNLAFTSSATAADTAKAAACCCGESCTCKDCKCETDCASCCGDACSVTAKSEACEAGACCAK